MRRRSTPASAAPLSLVQLRRYDEAYSSLKVLASVTPSAVVSNLMGIVQLRRRPARRRGGPLLLPPGRGAGRRPTPITVSISATPTGWTRMRPPPPTGCVKRSGAIPRTGMRTSCSPPRSRRRRRSGGRSRARAGPAALRTLGSGQPPESVPRGLERVKDRLSVSGQRMDSVLQEGVQRDQRETSAFHLEAARRAFEAGRDPETIREAQPGAVPDPLRCRGASAARPRPGPQRPAAGSGRCAQGGDLEQRDRNRARRPGRCAAAAARPRWGRPGRRPRAGARSRQCRGYGAGGAGQGRARGRADTIAPIGCDAHDPPDDGVREIQLERQAARVPVHGGHRGVGGDLPVRRAGRPRRSGPQRR